MDPSVHKFHRYKQLFGMFVQGGHRNSPHSRSDWDEFCVKSIQQDVPSKWHRLADKLASKCHTTVVNSITVDLSQRPQFRCSFNVGLALTIRALRLKGVSADIIDRTNKTLHTQQVRIDAARKTGTLRQMPPRECDTRHSRCLLYTPQPAHAEHLTGAAATGVRDMHPQPKRPKPHAEHRTGAAATGARDGRPEQKRPKPHAHGI